MHINPKASAQCELKSWFGPSPMFLSSFVIPTDRVAAALRSHLVEEYSREVTPSRFNSRFGRSGTLDQDANRAFLKRRKDYFAVRAIVRQDHLGFAPPRERIQSMCTDSELPLRLVVFQDVDFCPTN